MSYLSKIISIRPVTHDVRCIRLQKPQKYSFVPGQATDVAINKEGWEDQKRPFTFTSLNTDPYLEFTIKCYADRDGVTNQIGKLVEGEELIIDDPWGAIRYKGEGYFIAGGAGITPFIAIFRQLHKEGNVKGNQLYFSNKTSRDIILKEEFDSMLGPDVHYILTREDNPAYLKGPVNKDFLRREITDYSKPFYVCGPDKMIADINQYLTELGVDPETVVFEK